MKVPRKSAARHIDPDRGFIRNQEDKGTFGKRERSRSPRKQLRNEKCLDLYKTGVPTEDIRKQVSFRSENSVFRILRASGVKTDRRRDGEE